MGALRRPSPQAVRVLSALAAEPATWRYGYELGLEIGVRSGSLYPILVRMSDRGLLEATWEVDPTPGRPPRHLYRLTSRGLDYATAHGAPAAQRVRRSPRPALRGAS